MQRRDVKPGQWCWWRNRYDIGIVAVDGPILGGAYVCRRIDRLDPFIFAYAHQLTPISGDELLKIQAIVALGIPLPTELTIGERPS